MYEKNIKCVYMCASMHIHTHIFMYIHICAGEYILHIYPDIHIYIHVASQIVADLGKGAVGWKLGKDSAKSMSWIFLPFPQVGEGWAGLLDCAILFARLLYTYCIWDRSLRDQFNYEFISHSPKFIP